MFHLFHRGVSEVSDREILDVPPVPQGYVDRGNLRRVYRSRGRGQKRTPDDRKLHSQHCGKMDIRVYYSPCMVVHHRSPVNGT